MRSPTLFPFVSMHGDPGGRTPLVVLGDAAHVTLVHMEDDDLRVLYREDLDDAGIDPVEAYLAARDRLARLVRARLVSVGPVHGPWGTRCLVFQHSFLAASCLVLPNLFDMASAALGVDAMCVAVPRRDVLVVLPDLGAAFRMAARDILRANVEAEDAYPIFSLEPSGPGHMFTKRSIPSRVAA